MADNRHLVDERGNTPKKARPSNPEAAQDQEAVNRPVSPTKNPLARNNADPRAEGDPRNAKDNTVQASKKPAQKNSTLDAEKGGEAAKPPATTPGKKRKAPTNEGDGGTEPEPPTKRQRGRPRGTGTPKKTTPKKPATKENTPKKPAAKENTPKKPAAKGNTPITKPAAKGNTPKKPAAKESTSKKPAAKENTPKKDAANNAAEK